jgi:glycosyltransferase involved in cell wall biosynthesis
VPNERLADMMQDYTIFALPSLHEGLPKVLIEAMASGMVCVGTDIPGISDLIADGRTGYLAAGTSAEAIESALRRCLSEMNESIGRAARAAIEERLSIDSYARAEGALLLASIPAQAVPVTADGEALN